MRQYLTFVLVRALQMATRLKMWQFLLLLGSACLASAADLPPTCSRPVYCDSKLLHHVQLAKIFNDSKTFVDLEMNYDQNKTLEDFDRLLNETNQKPSREQIKNFVDKYFTSEGQLEDWVPSDFSTNPKFISNIKDRQLRQFGLDINNIWPIISRKVKDEVFEKPEQFSLIPIKNGFIVPGGRFQEIYYWDTYWIVEGLLVSGMVNTVKGVIENLIDLLNRIGHIPNGSRWYYQERSQPPLLSAMMAIYYKYTNDTEFIKDNIESLEKEISYFLDNKLISVTKDNTDYNLLRYNAPSKGPRPESYREDYEAAEKLDESERTDFFIELKSAAESGWDFSSRWFISEDGSNEGSLTDIKIRNIVPVDLNAIFTGVLQNTANFHGLLGNTRKAARYAELAEQWRTAIQAVLWNEKEGIWFDYDIKSKLHRKYFYPSNFAPLWQGAVRHELVILNGPRVVRYLQDSGALKFPGSIPTSLDNTGEQWDFPNVWPPTVSIVVNALEAINTKKSQQLAVQVAQKFVRSCQKGFSQYKQMFEKYNAERPGEYGGGGEYTVQIGFGWSNGVVLEFLSKYGNVLTANDKPSACSIKHFD
ncbi:unnamed protein product [Arctia plantaginis]|uniref:Trehalase n=1 Tax=Arctia plantaginis TaxID=874455 RepID=A0A8S1B839_ARCPL|nr:unnamed protein product [Arctia plantaginis]